MFYDTMVLEDRKNRLPQCQLYTVALWENAIESPKYTLCTRPDSSGRYTTGRLGACNAIDVADLYLRSKMTIVGHCRRQLLLFSVEHHSQQTKTKECILTAKTPIQFPLKPLLSANDSCSRRTTAITTLPYERGRCHSGSTANMSIPSRNSIVDVKLSQECLHGLIPYHRGATLIGPHPNGDVG